MKQVWIDRSWSDGQCFVDEISKILGSNDFNVELFGVGSLDTELPKDYKVVDYGSRETLAICKDGVIIDDKEEIERIENVEYIVDYSNLKKDVVEKYYDDKLVQEALSDYEYEQAIERINELNEEH